ncbi:MAG: AzlD domain-containing protein [Spirochaetaceae bacterium]|nr:AzlD domain-containing protein [Spirochaetaceae bacterium]
MSELNIMAVVFSAAVVNYLIRVTPFLMTNWEKVPLVVRRFLTIMPTAALGALIFPGAFTSLAETGRPWAALGGLGAAALTAHFSKNLIIPVAAAVLTTWAILQFP